MDLTLIILVLLALLSFYLKTYAPAQYLLVGWLVDSMVRAAEQRYKETAGAIDRRSLAKRQICTIMRCLKINADKWDIQIEWLIDAAITKLPKTKY